MALRQGARCIDIEVWNGEKDTQTGELVPVVCKSSPCGAVTNKLRLDRVLETIHKNAFETSDYPIIISAGVFCDVANQKAMANLFKTILGKSFLTEPFNSEEKELPSPEVLKRKIILMAPIKGIACKDNMDENQDTFHLGKVWMRLAESGKEWEQKEMIWKKKENTIAFGYSPQAADAEISDKPYFVGHMTRKSITNFINTHPNKKTGSFLVRYTSSSCSTFTLTIYTGIKRNEDGVIEVLLTHKNGELFLDSELDRAKKFSSMDELVSYFTVNTISRQTKLIEPLSLKSSNIYKFNDWFYGDLDAATCSTFMECVKKKGAFLVRGVKTDSRIDFFIEFFDGQSHKTTMVHQDTSGNISIPNHKTTNFESVTQVVNHLRHCFHVNATKLTEPILLKAEALEDHEDEEGLIFKRGEQRTIRRGTQGKLIIQKELLKEEGDETTTDAAKLKILAMGQHYEDANSLNMEQSFDLKGATITEKKLSPAVVKALKLAHDTMIQVESSDGAFNITKTDDIDLLLNQLQIHAGLSRQSSVGELNTSNDPDQTKAHTCDQNLTRDLTDMVIYCKLRKESLTLEHIDFVQKSERVLSIMGEEYIETLKLPPSSFQYTTATNDQALQCEHYENIDAFNEYHRKYLSKVFPRQNNFNPIPMWEAGVQMVSQHRQESGIPQQVNPVQVNRAMFATNGRCGYVLKPDPSGTSCIITLKIIEGRHLYTVKPPQEEFLIPHIKVIRLRFDILTCSSSGVCLRRD